MLSQLLTQGGWSPLLCPLTSGLLSKKRVWIRSSQMFSSSEPLCFRIAHSSHPEEFAGIPFFVQIPCCPRPGPACCGASLSTPHQPPWLSVPRPARPSPPGGPCTAMALPSSLGGLPQPCRAVVPVPTVTPNRAPGFPSFVSERTRLLASP